MSPSDKADAFLGGRIFIRQGSYRAGADPVFLAASVRAKPGQSVLELGTGAGVALLCLGARVPGLELVGIERDITSAALARTNASENGVEAEIVEGDIETLPATLKDRSFDHVLMNPPYFLSGTRSSDGGRRSSRHEDTPLALWIDVGIRRLRPGGGFVLIQKAERLAEVLSAIQDRLGNMTVLPLSPRVGRSANHIVLRGTKGARGPLKLLAPLVLHTGDSHQKDGDSYTEQASAVLRDAAALPD